MALSILDGNQTATTLSTVVTSGQHITAHTIVSLGTQAVVDITSAISGTSVCVGNLGLLQSTVATEGLIASTTFIKIGGHSGTSTTGNIVHVSSIGALRVDGSTSTQPVSLTSLPAISGTVTANLGTSSRDEVYQGILSYALNEGGDGSAPLNINVGNPASIIGGGYANLFSLAEAGDLYVKADITNALPAGTNRIGVVTASLSAGTAQIGSVTASLAYSQTATTISSTAVTAIPVVFPTSGAYGGSLQGYNGTNTYIYSGIQAIGSTSLASATSLPVSLGSLPALVAGTAQIGSVTASISGTVPISISSVTVGNSVTIGSCVTHGVTIANTVVTFYPLQGTTVTNSNFTSTTASTTLVSAVVGTKVLTVFNEGAGNLHISPSATCTTISYQVRLSSGDYWECPAGQLSLAHTAVFATAGTARVTQIS